MCVFFTREAVLLLLLFKLSFIYTIYIIKKKYRPKLLLIHVPRADYIIL